MKLLATIQQLGIPIHSWNPLILLGHQNCMSDSVKSQESEFEEKPQELWQVPISPIQPPSRIILTEIHKNTNKAMEFQGSENMGFKDPLCNVFRFVGEMGESKDEF